VSSKTRQELKSLLGAWPMILLALLLLVAFSVPSVHEALGAWFGGWFANLHHAPIGHRSIVQEQRGHVLCLSLMGVVLGLKPAVNSYSERHWGVFAFWAVGIAILLLLGLYPMLMS